MTGHDPGLQPERTALAWRRTAFSAAVVAALVLRKGIVDGSPVAVSGAACISVVLVAAALRSRTTRPWPAIITAALAVGGGGLATALHILLSA